MNKPYGYVRADGKGLFIYGDHQFTNNQDHDLIPVYTHPKEWVGLTDEEVEKLDCVQVIWQDEGEVAIHGIKEFYRNIDAKLKEKNSA